MIARARQYGCRLIRARGLTLVEMVVAVAVTSVLMLGLASAMLMAGRALPEARSPAGACVAAAAVAEQMATELQYAVSINQRSATMIEFAVADRNDDDVVEIIRYGWSGTSGAPLTRQYNGGTVVNVLTDIREFDLSYDLTTITTEIPLPNESAETTLVSYSSTQDLHDYPIKDGEWYAQYFLPALPANAISWRVTHVLVHAKQDGASDGEARVQLQLPTSGKYPSGIVLEEKTLLESALLSGYLEQEFSFSSTDELTPTQGLCIVLKWIANGTACKVRGRDKNVTVSSLALAKSTNRGVLWSPLPSQSLLFTVYGTVTTAGTPQIQNTYHLDGVEIRLWAGSDPQSLVQTNVRALNGPEVIQ
jgi:prepilin-type N-terminal cleavage/methylation domain-containing protein